MRLTRLLLPCWRPLDYCRRMTQDKLFMCGWGFVSFCWCLYVLPIQSADTVFVEAVAFAVVFVAWLCSPCRLGCRYSGSCYEENHMPVPLSPKTPTKTVQLQTQTSTPPKPPLRLCNTDIKPINLNEVAQI